MCAARNNRVQVVDYLLDTLEDVKIDAVDVDGQTAIFHAALFGHACIVRRLIEMGTTVDRKNKVHPAPRTRITYADCCFPLGIEDSAARGLSARPLRRGPAAFGARDGHGDA